MGARPATPADADPRGMGRMQRRAPSGHGARPEGLVAPGPLREWERDPPPRPTPTPAAWAGCNDGRSGVMARGRTTGRSGAQVRPILAEPAGVYARPNQGAAGDARQPAGSRATLSS